MAYEVVTEETRIPAAQNAAALKARHISADWASLFPALDRVLAVDGHIEGEFEAGTGDVLVREVKVVRRGGRG